MDPVRSRKKDPVYQLEKRKNGMQADWHSCGASQTPLCILVLEKDIKVTTGNLVYRKSASSVHCILGKLLYI